MTVSRDLNRLKALQSPVVRNSLAVAPAQAGGFGGRSPEIPEAAARLAQILGATTKSNRFGDHLALRKWYSEPVTDAPDLGAPDGQLDPAALQLLAPEAWREISDPRQWLFLETETTG